MHQAITTPNTFRTRRELRAAVCAIARDRGGLWLRPILDAAGVELVSRLPTPVLRAIVRDELIAEYKTAEADAVTAVGCGDDDAAVDCYAVMERAGMAILDGLIAA